MAEGLPSKPQPQMSAGSKPRFDRQGGLCGFKSCPRPDPAPQPDLLQKCCRNLGLELRYSGGPPQSELEGAKSVIYWWAAEGDLAPENDRGPKGGRRIPKPSLAVANEYQSCHVTGILILSPRVITMNFCQGQSLLTDSSLNSAFIKCHKSGSVTRHLRKIAH
ncbi:hypothetical protein A6R68_06493 [Neotoma lepida]|uniref:Uncharacterized protein n=1 Tax=Neotoma lepida TaxID=56216 RepID=A0A1A6GI30_NEOLE|nr:hypothetical protein A6R68_06493 [Neotoma lepida]